MVDAKWMVAGALNGLVAVAAGAFGAHYLKSRLSTDDLGTFEVAVRYQFYHALALLAVAILMHLRPSSGLQMAGACFLGGIVLFSGSLYGLSLCVWKWLGPVTPIGGLLLIVGWLMTAWSALQNPKAVG